MTLYELIDELKRWAIQKVEIDEDYREGKTWVTITYQNGAVKEFEIKE